VKGGEQLTFSRDIEPTDFPQMT